MVYKIQYLINTLYMNKKKSVFLTRNSLFVSEMASLDS